MNPVELQLVKIEARDRDFGATMARKREKLYDAMIEYFGALVPAQYTRKNAADDIDMIERSIFDPTYHWCDDCDGLVVKTGQCCIEKTSGGVELAKALDAFQKGWVEPLMKAKGHGPGQSKPPEGP